MGGTNAHEAFVRAAGGAMVVSHHAISVVFAHSTDAAFAAKLLRLDPDLRSVGTHRTPLRAFAIIPCPHAAKIMQECGLCDGVRPV